MEEVSILDKQKFIFGRLISLSNRLQAVGDQALGASGITVRQWLLTLAIARFGDTAPTLNEVSQVMDSSHQNVKQLAMKLEKSGFLHIQKDERDGRAVRLKLTERSYLFWKEKQHDVRDFLAELFKDLSEEEICSLYDCLNKLYEGALRMGKALLDRKV